MTCDELRQRLLADQELPEAARAHLASCHGCRAASERWFAVRAALRTGRSEPPPPFLHARIMAGVRAQPQKAPAWWRRVPQAAWAGTAVAVLIVGVVVTQVVRWPAGPDRAVPLAEFRAPHEAPAVDAAEQPPSIREPDTHELKFSPAPPEPAPAQPLSRRAVRVEERLPAPPVGHEPEPAREDRTAVATGSVPAFREAPDFQAATEKAAGQPPPSMAPGSVHPAPQASRPDGRLERSLESAAGRHPPILVRVALLPEGEDRSVPLELEDTAAPPSGQTWIALLDEVGRVRLEGPFEDDRPRLEQVYQRALAGLNLPPGLHRVIRAQP